MIVKVYTISDLKKWIYQGVKNGLSSSVISNARALALLQNPYTEDNDPAIAVAYDSQNNTLGYTAVFKEKCQNECMYWGTTGFIAASMRGKGVGTKLYSVMMDACHGRWFALDSAPAALTISKKTGLNIHYYYRYYLSFCYSSSLKSKLLVWWVQRKNRCVQKSLNPFTQLEVLRYIDDETYSFIEQHMQNDLFHRSRIMLNWMLQSPFKTIAPSDLQEYSSYEFTTAIPLYYIYAFRIMKDEQIIGFAMFRQNMGDLVLLYIYKDEKYQNEVYASLIKHILSQKLRCFRTFDRSFIDFYNRIGAVSMNTKSRTQQISLSTPTDFLVDSNLCIQGGDGDMFC